MPIYRGRYGEIVWTGFVWQIFRRLLRLLFAEYSLVKVFVSGHAYANSQCAWNLDNCIFEFLSCGYDITGRSHLWKAANSGVRLRCRERSEICAFSKMEVGTADHNARGILTIEYFSAFLCWGCLLNGRFVFGGKNRMRKGVAPKVAHLPSPYGFRPRAPAFLHPYPSVGSA